MRALFLTCLTLFFTTIFLSCDKNETDFNDVTTKAYLPDQSNERGVIGCGIPCDPDSTATNNPGCTLPNGMCHYAQVAGPVDFDFDGNDPFGVIELEMLTAEKIRFINLSETEYNEEELIRDVLKRINPQHENRLPEIVEFVKNNYNVPDEIPFSEKDSKRLLKQIKVEGSQVTLIPGEYPITKTDKYPYGYYDIDIKIK